MADGETRAIRQATAGDLAALQAISEAAFAPYIRRIGRRPAPMEVDLAPEVGRTLVCGDPVLGYMIVDHRGPEFWIEVLAVDPAAQGQGVGEDLLTWAAREAQASSCHLLRLYTNVAMTEALNWYAARGFRERWRGLEDGFHRVYLDRPIGPCGDGPNSP